MNARFCIKAIISVLLLSLLLFPVLAGVFTTGPGAGGGAGEYNPWDGYIYSGDSDYPTTKTVPDTVWDDQIYLWVGQRRFGSSGLNTRERIYLKFNTSSIPAGATITSANLSLYLFDKIISTGYDFTIRLRKWTDDVPIELADYNEYDGTNYDDGNADTSGMTEKVYNDIVISNFNLIVKNGYTLICILSDDDLNDQQLPIYKQSRAEFYAWEAGTDYIPILYVEYEAEEKQWHNISSWNFNLTARQWLIASTWNFNLSTRQWVDATLWTFNLTTMQWQNIIQWEFSLISLGWRTITLWIFTLQRARNVALYVMVIVFASILGLGILLMRQKR